MLTPISTSSTDAVVIPSPVGAKSESVQATVTVSEKGMSDFEARTFIATSYFFSWLLLGALVFGFAGLQRWWRRRRYRNH